MNKTEMLGLLQEKVCRCVKCPALVEGRIQTVFGEGDQNAQVMLIGEAPGAEEAKSGRPFVGIAGELLTNIIKACGWKREDVYICNILKCRPPNNRLPEPQEAANCSAFLKLQIKIIRPKVIVAVGACAAQNLLGTSDGINRLRGNWHEYRDGELVIPVMPTFHPAYLLRLSDDKKKQKEEKAKVWLDMKKVKERSGR